MPDTDLVTLTERDLAGLRIDPELVIDVNPTRYIHTRRPGLLARNAPVAAMAVVAVGTVAAGFTGRLELDSPLAAALIVLMYALAWWAITVRKRADQHAVPSEVQP